MSKSNALLADPPVPAAAGEFLSAPIELLDESKLNPRKTFDPKGMEELTASVSAKGVITPLLVRPTKDGRCEIAAGHRRYRAAKAAGSLMVPVVSRAMDDKTFIEIMVMENDERADLHPLEEAAGYQLLITKAGSTAEKIALRRGCSTKYVWDRIKLLQLTKEAQDLFRDNRFEAGHAILLARLSPADQARAIKSGLFEREQTLFGPHSEGVERGGGKYANMKARSVRELDGWIDRHVRFGVEDAHPLLFPETAQVLEQAAKDESKIVKITHANVLSPEARDAKERTFSRVSWKRADGKAGSKICDHAVVGVIAADYGRGQAFPVCVEKKKCEVHWNAEMKESAARATRRGKAGGAPASKANDAKAAARAKADEDRRRREVAVARVLEKIAGEQILAKVGKADEMFLRFVASVLAGAVWTREGFRERHGLTARNQRDGLEKLVAKAKAAELPRLIVDILLSDDNAEACASDELSQELALAAAVFGVDAKALIKAAEAAVPPLEVEKPAPAKGKAPAKAKAKPAGKGKRKR